MENRTTHNLAAVLFDTVARLNNKADTICSNVEYHGESPVPAGVEAAPIAVNDVLNRVVDQLLRLENRIDRIHESVGCVYQPDPSMKQGIGAGQALAGQTLARR